VGPVTERPILFSTEMVRAILEGRKTQTRRVLNPQPSGRIDRTLRRYGNTGDRLWVKETFTPDFFGAGLPAYRADCHPDADHFKPEGIKWTSGRFMPKRSARLWLEIGTVRVERLHEITEADARAEGFPLTHPIKARRTVRGLDGRVTRDTVDLVDFTARGGFAHAWDAINGKRAPWATNPYVWVISFNRVVDASKGGEHG
jgi:hypothetical protein